MKEEEERLGTLSNLLKYVCEQGEEWYRGRPRTAGIVALRENIMRNFPSAQNIQDLRTKLTNLKKGCDLKDNYVFLQPVDEKSGIVPIMTFQFTAGNLKVRSALFKSIDEAVGYRFESPDHTSNGNRFFHAQPIKELSLTKQSTLPHPGWVPERQLTFPLDAKDPLSLFISFLISLYGEKYLLNLFRVGHFGPKLKRIVGEMHLSRFLSI